MLVDMVDLWFRGFRTKTIGEPGQGRVDEKGRCTE